MIINKFAVRVMALAAGFLGTFTSAIAEERRIGAPVPGQLGFQQAATETMERITSFHNGLLITITIITIFVTALLAWIIIRYNRKANPVPAKFSHNTMLEVVWTLVPVLILVAIGIPSIRLLYFQDTIPAEPDIVIKVTGHQWYWSYEYPDENGLAFDAIMLPSNYWDADAPADIVDERAEAEADIQRMLGRTGPLEIRRLLDADTRVVVPVGKVVKILLTADDVLHAWTIPAFGFKIDAVPGRLNETWFKADVVGTFYGQCSELCGIRHAFMPIVVEVVTEQEYAAWLRRAHTAYASNTHDGSSHLALAETVQ